MAEPSQTTVTIDGNKFNALATHFGFHTNHDHTGMPLMGQQLCSIGVTVDIHDTINMPFGTLSTLFDMSHDLTRDKVREIVIEY